MVSRNELGDEGATILCNALRESTVTKVEELDLSYNDIGPDGAKAIAALCAVCASLTSLSLRKNPLGDEGVEVLAQGIKASKTLKTLDLSMPDMGRFKIGPRGATAIADALSVSSSLTSLSTAYNDISGDGAQQLAAAVLSKPTL